MKLNLDDTNVNEVEVTREQVRRYFDNGDLTDEVELAFDTAQGACQDEASQYLVVKIIN